MLFIVLKSLSHFCLLSHWVIQIPSEAKLSIFLTSEVGSPVFSPTFSSCPVKMPSSYLELIIYFGPLLKPLQGSSEGLFESWRLMNFKPIIDLGLHLTTFYFA